MYGVEFVRVYSVVIGCNDEYLNTDMDCLRSSHSVELLVYMIAEIMLCACCCSKTVFVNHQMSADLTLSLSSIESHATPGDLPD